MKAEVVGELPLVARLSGSEYELVIGDLILGNAWRQPSGRWAAAIGGILTENQVDRGAAIKVVVAAWLARSGRAA